MGQLFYTTFQLFERMAKCCLKSMIFASKRLAPMAYSLKFYSIKCFVPICFNLVAFFDWNVRYKVMIFALNFLDSNWLLSQLSWEVFACVGWDFLSWAESLSVLGQLLYTTVQLFGTNGKMMSQKRDFCVKPTCSYGLCFVPICFYLVAFFDWSVR